MPEAAPSSSAHARHRFRTGQARQIRLASLIWSSAGPVVPIGKNRSGSASRQAASSRQFVSVVIGGSLLMSALVQEAIARDALGDQDAAGRALERALDAAE